MLFWKSRNYEKELELLAEKIRNARTAANKAKVNNRRYRSLFILYSVAVYLCYVAVAVSSGSYLTSAAKFFFAAIPLAIYVLYRGLSAILLWRERRTAAHLEAMQHNRDGLVEEYKEKVNYSQIQKVLSSGKDTAEEAESKATPKALTNNSKILPGSGLKQRKGPKSPQPKQQPKNTEWPAQKKPAAKNIAPLKPGVGPADPLLVPAPNPAHSSWIDRLADLVLGENETSPNSRYALICPVCYTHNGLASYGQAPNDVVYRCPVCATLNNGDKLEEKEPKLENKKNHTKDSKLEDSNTSKPEKNTVEPEVRSEAQPSKLKYSEMKQIH